MSNLKIDIIYYKTTSDFEMEFNLSGCCRMRMFKDKVETTKGLVNALDRDVARSKIILIVTDLFGENSGIPTIANAISLPLSAINKKEYGIKTTDNISLPKTAVPLVTKSGIYGGCIIESGPQSIIIISSARALRHEIMKSYVHNYVFDVGQFLAYQERMGANNPAAPVGVSSLKSVAKANANNQDTAESNIAENTINTNEPANDTTEKSPVISAGINAAAEFEIEEVEVDETAPLVVKCEKKGNNTANIILLIIVVLLLIGFGILAYYFVYLPLTGNPGVFTNSDGNFITDFLSGLFE